MANRRLNRYLPLPHRDLVPAEKRRRVDDTLSDAVKKKRSDDPEPQLQPPCGNSPLPSDTSNPVQHAKVAKTDQLLCKGCEQPTSRQIDAEVHANAPQAAAPQTADATAATGGSGGGELSAEKQEEKREPDYGGRRSIRDSIMARDDRWDNNDYVKGRPMMIVITTGGREVTYNRATIAARAAQDAHKKEAGKDEVGEGSGCTLN